MVLIWKGSRQIPMPLQSAVIDFDSSSLGIPLSEASPEDRRQALFHTGKWEIVTVKPQPQSL